ncbi:hypothetical protein CVT24_001952 [Panaeolus cyanescens]|uniref:RBR-type E3 ubiquitin transferase n=1 Tax=Panaeolus cyanescens TaxID=181874 RepID=A0A409YHQ5_9AGAR|nr:hypothetical protein CVT24_001952 [Panaeolus cyanescens]
MTAITSTSTARASGSSSHALLHHAHPFTTIDESDVDFETARLIAELHLQDIADIEGRRKGKGRAGVKSDEEYALELMMSELQSVVSISEDNRLAQSISKALETDAAYLDAFMTAEAAAEADRRVAEAVSNGQPLPPPIPAQTRLEHRAFDMEPKFVDDSLAPIQTVKSLAPKVKGTDAGKQPVRTVSHTPAGTIASSSRSGTKEPRVECTACGERVRVGKAFLTSCSHQYCPDCLNDLVEAFTRDESLYPLRCCKEPIDIHAVRPFITKPGLATLFEVKHSEFSVPVSDRLYCAAPTCSAFLDSVNQYRDQFVQCPNCAFSTCRLCKQAYHFGDCAHVNAATDAVRDLARQQGWQTCPGCNAIVELDVGCYHMTCRCRKEFCYLCAQTWKQCTCPQWDENRLVTAAQQRVQNEVGVREAAREAYVAPIAWQARIREMANTLRENHECNNHSWRYRHGGGQCQSCYHTLPQFLLICRNCRYLACKRCTLNRL